MRLRYILICAVLLSGLTLPAGCGKKAPPFLPKTEEAFSLRVEKLEAREQGGQIRLSGTVIPPQGRREKLPALKLCRVYYVRYPAGSSPCDGCPISFNAYEEIRPDISGDGRFRCTIRLKKISGIYFMVRLVAEGGTVGPPSNRAKLLVK